MACRAGNWFIEVTLVEDCTEVDCTREPPWLDPCASRYSWFNRLQPDGTVSLLFDEGDPALPPPPAQ